VHHSTRPLRAENAAGGVGHAGVKVGGIAALRMQRGDGHVGPRCPLLS
jgi:hypothetical protein